MSVMRGTFVRSLRGEIDRDENDCARVTPAGSVGQVVGITRHAYARDGEQIVYQVEFENGGWVFLHENEIRDTSQYEIVADIGPVRR